MKLINEETGWLSQEFHEIYNEISEDVKTISKKVHNKAKELGVSEKERSILSLLLKERFYTDILFLLAIELIDEKIGVKDE